MNPPDKAKWWTNRRRMAWTAMIAGVGFPVLHLFTDLSSIASPFYVFVGTVVFAYIVAATADDVISLRGGKP